MSEHRIANENGVEYWNFDLYKYDIGLSMEHYKDGSHLNGMGAEIYTEFFCYFANSFNSGEVSSSDVFYEKY